MAPVNQHSRPRRPRQGSPGRHHEGGNHQHQQHRQPPLALQNCTGQRRGVYGGAISSQNTQLHRRMHDATCRQRYVTHSHAFTPHVVRMPPAEHRTVEIRTTPAQLQVGTISRIVTTKTARTTTLTRCWWCFEVDLFFMLTPGGVVKLGVNGATVAWQHRGCTRGNGAPPMAGMSRRIVSPRRFRRTM